jgi:hypothetical protein
VVPRSAPPAETSVALARTGGEHGSASTMCRCV